MASTALSRLDLRAVPTWERPAQILKVFESMPIDGSFVFVSDHEPRPLIMRLEHLHPGASAWTQRHVGDHEWEVELLRIDPHQSGSSCLHYLRRSVFSKTSAQTQDRLAEAAVEVVARKGTVVFDENEPCTELGFLAEGSLSLSTGAKNGRERVLFDVLPFEPFGVVQVLDGGLTLGRLTVLSRKARYLRFPIDLVHALMEKDPELVGVLGLLCAQRARAMAHRLAAQVSQSTITRIATVLLPYAMPELGLQRALPPVGLLTQSQLAAAAGTVKEVAARAIAELESKGALRRERGHVHFLDRNKLLEYVV